MIQLSIDSWRAVIDPLRGGNVVSLTHAGEPILRTPAQALDDTTFGMPLLLPANRTYAGRFNFEGKTYQMPINEPQTPAQLHGSLHRQAFELRYANEQRAVLSYSNEGKIYPFPFCVLVSYYLDMDGFHADYEIINTGASAMPLIFGLHSCFVEPAFFCVPIAQEQEREGVLPTGRYVPLSKACRDYLSGTNPHGRSISGFYRACGHEAVIGDYKYQVSEAFDHWILYNAGGHAGLLCVEPQCGAVNGLNLEGGYRRIEAGERLKLETSLHKR